MSMLKAMLMKKKGEGLKTGYIESSGNGEYIDLSPIQLHLSTDDIFTLVGQAPNYMNISGESMFGYFFHDSTYGNNSFFFFCKLIWISKYTGLNHDVMIMNNNSSQSISDSDNGQYKGNLKFVYTTIVEGNERKPEGYNYKLFDATNAFTCRIWSVSVERNGEKIVDLVATEQNSVAGMLDKVSGIFLANSGTGNLTFVEDE